LRFGFVLPQRIRKDRKDEVPTMKLQPIAKKGGPEKGRLDDVVQKDESVTIRHFDAIAFCKTGIGSLRSGSFAS